MTDTQVWLAERIGLEDTNEVTIFLQYEDASLDNPKKGRAILDFEIRQQMYNLWKLNSEIGVHRSNRRHEIR